MGCDRIDLGGGGFAIICSRGRRRPTCKACKDRPATRQCDWPLTGRAAGKTCDANLCERCAVHVGEDRDYCPAHARVAERQLELGVEPDGLDLDDLFR